MKRIILALTLIMVIGVMFTGCSAGIQADYNTQEFESALNKGEDVSGKTVSVEVLKLNPKSAFGYDIEAGEHLNFVSAENPGVKAGDTIVLTIDKVASLFGSYIITYKK